MRAIHYVGIACLAAVLAVTLVSVGIALAPEHKVAVLLGVYLFIGLICLGAARQVRRQMSLVEKSIMDLPAFSTPSDRMDADFEGAIAAAKATSARLQGRLGAADEDRRELEALLDSMQDAVVAVDPAGRIQWTNQRMQRLIPGGNGASAVSSSVRVGHSLVQTIRDPDVLECVRRSLDEGVVNVRRSTSMMPGRIFEVNASPMPGGGAVAVLHDVTRIEEVERTQRDFVANVSHELRTPLTSITGYVETLLDHEVLSAEAREFLGTILKNAMRMTRLTEDLLVMARVESSAVDLHPTPVPADELVHDAVRALSGLVVENEATLEIGPMTDCQVFADTDAVMQVLSNLIENAIKYGHPRVGGGSRVVISAREVHEPYDAVEFSVKDSGTGIASEHLGRIFERFYRVDKTRSRESGGTGLGLAIARHMVQTQGGAIWAESELGQGSTFRFTLPKAIYPVEPGARAVEKMARK